MELKTAAYSKHGATLGSRKNFSSLPDTPSPDIKIVPTNLKSSLRSLEAAPQDVSPVVQND
jgi:hypothetical protein